MALGEGGEMTVTAQPGLSGHSSFGIKGIVRGMGFQAARLQAGADKLDARAARYQERGRTRQAEKAREEAAQQRSEASVLLSLVQVVELSLPAD